MDEVEIIQDYLISQAGEGTDVILGLGYDNTLGGKIGITLIATGFDHKDPFEKKEEIKTEQKDEKIVMTLEMPPKEEKKKVQQPVLQFEDSSTSLTAEDEEAAIAEITEQPALQVEEDTMMPVIKEAAEEPVVVKLPSKNTGDKLDESPVFFEISSATDQVPVFEFDIPQSPPPVDKPAKVQNEITVINKEASTPPSSGGYLAKPAQIYVEEKPKPESNSTDELLPKQENQQEDEPAIEMHLVVKSHQAAEEEQHVQPAQPIMISDVEEPAMQDEAEDLRRRAMDRIAKLRNLSFNINAADPNNEFETVPAYLRRNMELHNSIADVESFYSNYTVKTDENNQAEISTLNSFLEGKKPD
jgi:cell division protein FtsZ